MLVVHRAAQATSLVGQLIDVLRDASADDPFQPEVVAVHSRGIERWLTQELSRHLGTAAGQSDGVAANITFPFPKTVVDWAMNGVPRTGLSDQAPTVDPWDPNRAMWTLLGLLEDFDPADLGPLGSHLSGDHGRIRRAPAMLHVASLFDRYAVHRPSLIAAWADGDDVDSRGAPLLPGDAWQPRLWRAARQHLGPSFAERVAAVAAGDAALHADGLPRHLSLFGLTALPATYLEVLDILGRSRDVDLFVLHPSPALWRDVAPRLSGVGEPRPLRSADPTAQAAHHPLLGSWGRDSRELQLLLRDTAMATPGSDAEAPGSGIAAPDPAAITPATLLAQLQQDIQANVAPPGPPLPGTLDLRRGLTTTARLGQSTMERRADDRSVQVHACHGRLRQVEVLRDVVLGLLSDDPALQPRDIVVMCPDVEAFAPLVEAVFTADAHLSTSSGATGLPDVRVRLADRALREVNPLLRTVATLLQIPDGRVEGSTVMELAHQEPVRSRFGFSTGDLEVIEEWVDELGIRWGLDLDHRVSHGLHTRANTWQAGLDRLLLGIAVEPDGPLTVAGVRPHDEVEGSAVDLAGRLAELVDRIDALVAGLAGERPIAAWCQALRHHVDALTNTADADAWQRVQFDRMIDDVLESAGHSGADDAGTASGPDVTLPELRTLLNDRLRGRPSRANHRTGDLTVCTLVPMRSVPYRVVCLLGLDDETFPRRTVANGDDLIARHARVGDRDPRTEDRQLLLDALLAAGDHLVVTYTGRDERTDSPTPPAVPLAELLDAIDVTARTDTDGLPASVAITHRHPLRSADARSFDAAAPFGFDPISLAGARARLDPARPAPRFLDALPAAGPAPTTISWGDFTAFLRNPVKVWLRTRLGVSLRSADDASDDLLPLELDNLASWAVGTRLLKGSLDDDLEAWILAERGRGSLPVGAIGEATLETLATEVRSLHRLAVERFGDDLASPPHAHEVDLHLGDVRIVGTVTGLRGPTLATVDYGRPKPKRLMDLWLPWLALTAMGRPVQAVLVSRGATKRELARANWFDPEPDATAAHSILEQLVELYLHGLDQPLVLFESASGEYAEGLAGKGQGAADRNASNAWLTKAFQGRAWGDRLDPAVQQVFGDLSYDEMHALAPKAWQVGPGWDDGQPGAFGRLALRLWGPVFRRRQTVEVRA